MYQPVNIGRYHIIMLYSTGFIDVKFIVIGTSIMCYRGVLEISYCRVTNIFGGLFREVSRGAITILCTRVYPKKVKSKLELMKTSSYSPYIFFFNVLSTGQKKFVHGLLFDDPFLIDYCILNKNKNVLDCMMYILWAIYAL